MNKGVWGKWSRRRLWWRGMRGWRRVGVDLLPMEQDLTDTPDRCRPSPLVLVHRWDNHFSPARVTPSLYFINISVFSPSLHSWPVSKSFNVVADSIQNAPLIAGSDGGTGAHGTRNNLRQHLHHSSKFNSIPGRNSSTSTTPLFSCNFATNSGTSLQAIICISSQTLRRAYIFIKYSWLQTHTVIHNRWSLIGIFQEYDSRKNHQEQKRKQHCLRSSRPFKKKKNSSPEYLWLSDYTS